MSKRIFINRRTGLDRRTGKDQRQNPRLDLKHRRRRKTDDRRDLNRTGAEHFYALNNDSNHGNLGNLDSLDKH